MACETLTAPPRRGRSRQFTSQRRHVGSAARSRNLAVDALGIELPHGSAGCAGLIVELERLYSHAADLGAQPATSYSAQPTLTPAHPPNLLRHNAAITSAGYCAAPSARAGLRCVRCPIPTSALPSVSPRSPPDAASVVYDRFAGCRAAPFLYASGALGLPGLCCHASWLRNAPGSNTPIVLPCHRDRRA